MALLLLAAAAALLAHRAWPALLALLVALIPWTAWRMSGDLDPLWIDLGPAALNLQLRSRRLAFPLPVAAARRLTQGEIAHLQGLATTGGVTVASGGFDSSHLGELELYASDLGKAVLLDWGETRLVLTPDDPEAFLAALGSP